jgi:hypothetical protein
MKKASKKTAPAKPMSPELAALPPEFREMTMNQLLTRFNGVREVPEAIIPWLDVARKASRLATIQELARLRDSLNSTLDRLLTEAL